MAPKPKPMTVRAKRGDDFRLNMSVKDRKSEEALTAYNTYKEAYEIGQNVINADPPDAGDIAAQAAIVANLKAAYELICIVNITGWIITAAVGWAGKTIFQIPINVLDAPNGNFDVYMPSAQSGTLKPREYDVEVQFTRADGKIISSENFKLILEGDYNPE